VQLFDSDILGAIQGLSEILKCRLYAKGVGEEAGGKEVIGETET
jgi:hypothetical protein